VGVGFVWPEGSAMDEIPSLQEFVRVRGPALSRFAYLLTSDHDNAQDLVQAALVKVVRRWPMIAAGNPEAYLRRGSYSQRISLGKRRRFVERPVDSVPEQASAGDATATVDLYVTLTRALAQLKPRQRAVIVLRYYEDRSEAETAQILGITPGTVKSQAHHG